MDSSFGLFAVSLGRSIAYTEGSQVNIISLMIEFVIAQSGISFGSFTLFQSTHLRVAKCSNNPRS